jgi:uncharacterized membrane protein (UPF0127 family)
MIRGRLERTGGLLAETAWLAETWRERTGGLLIRPPLGAGEALIIPTQAVHTVGMRYPLDLVYLDRAWAVILCREAVPPGRFAPWRARTRWVVELPAGTLGPVRLRVGEFLRFVPMPDRP